MSLGDTIKAVVLGAWGDDIFFGMLLEALSDTTADEIYEFIRDDKSLLSLVIPDKDRIIKEAHYLDLDALLNPENILTRLISERPDIVGIILNSPKGISWLNKQLLEIREEIGKSQQAQQQTQWRKVDNGAKQ